MEAGQRPQRGRSPVEHSGTFFHSTVLGLISGKSESKLDRTILGSGSEAGTDKVGDRCPVLLRPIDDDNSHDPIPILSS